MSDRIQREKSFHNSRFSTEGGEGVRDRMSPVTQRALDATYRAIRAGSEGRTVLEYGCGQGEASLIIARKYQPHHVVGIDISDVAVEQARAEAQRLGLTNASFEVMNAEAMDFPDDHFDLICGFGILHHLDLDAALPEIGRVLEPGGNCVFLEPLGHNPVVNLYRRMTPEMRTPDEHPLLVSDYSIFAKHFERLDLEYVNLTTLVAVPFARWPGASLFVTAAAGVDRALFAIVPFLRRHAWNVVLKFSGPKRHSSPA